MKITGAFQMFRGFRDDQSGVATIEFVIVAPLLFMIVMSVFEAGWLMTRFMMLDRGLDMTVRDIRLGKSQGAEHDDIKAQICGFASILRDCEDTLVLEITPLRLLPVNYPKHTATCTDRTAEIESPVEFDPGARNEIMFVRACVIIDPIFPGMGIGMQLPKDSSGGFQMTSYSAFMNEPK